jgi:transposase-like protein
MTSNTLLFLGLTHIIHLYHYHSILTAAELSYHSTQSSQSSPILSMPFRHYNAKTKVDAVILILEGKTDLEVQAAIREAPHQRTLNRWVKLYQDTQRVIRDPASYDRRGRPTFFNNEDREFIKRIVATN